MRTHVHSLSNRATTAETALRRPFLLGVRRLLHGPEAASVRLSEALSEIVAEFRLELAGAAGPSRKLMRAAGEAAPLMAAARRPGRPALEFRLAQAVRDAMFFTGEYRREASAYGTPPPAGARALAALASDAAACLRDAAALAPRDRARSRRRLEDARAFLRGGDAAHHEAVAAALRGRDAVQGMKVRELVRHMHRLLESVGRCVRPLEEAMGAR